MVRFILRNPAVALNEPPQVSCRLPPMQESAQPCSTGAPGPKQFFQSERAQMHQDNPPLHFIRHGNTQFG
jgi:hypothetical protein